MTRANPSPRDAGRGWTREAGPGEGHARDRLLRLIAAFRFTKAVLLIAGGIVLLHPIRFVPEWIARFPHVMALVSKLRDPRREHLIAIAAFAYAALFIAEGTGLWMGRVWAEWLTIVATASFLPFEIYEAVEKFSALRCGIIVVNAAILGYLIWRVRRAER